jgi:hypothetical protein
MHVTHTGSVACMSDVSSGEAIFIGWSSDIVNHRVKD